MKTKQALFLVAVNVIFAITAIRWFERSWEQLRYLIHYLYVRGHGGATREAGVWSITVRNYQSEVVAHFTNYPAIFFFLLVGVNVFFILVFILWNNSTTIERKAIRRKYWKLKR